MSLSSLQLDAFLEVARTGSFSLAAKNLNVTQSALSQRVLNLEEDLETSLFVRSSTGVRMTEYGQELLRYCQSKESLENEFLSQFRTSDKDLLSGVLRVGGFSTVTRSVIIPTLASLSKKNPSIRLEIMTRELVDLPKALESGALDFIFLTHPLDQHDTVSHLIGYEENVLVESKKAKARTDVFLDHDINDTITKDFFKIQSKTMPKIQRFYFDDIYSIIDGVIHGFGKAVVPRHIVGTMNELEIVKGFKPLKTPVYLVYFRKAFYTKLQTDVITLFREKAGDYLNP